MHFNPRTPCGVRQSSACCWMRGSRFQSTHPLRGATPFSHRCSVSIRYFNPRTPCGVRLPKKADTHEIHSHFNPRTPCGVRHMHWWTFLSAYYISIHAPLAGCDKGQPLQPDEPKHFNPRTPCGVRLGGRELEGPLHNFNPRTPCGVRRILYQQEFNFANFNPRTPCGVRPDRW